MKIELSQYGLKDAIDRIEFLKDNIKIASEETVYELVFKGGVNASFLNSTAPKTGPEKSTINADINKTNYGFEGIISLQGPNAVYDEFGVGEKGKEDPHPIKSNFNLNPYNSGPYVSTHINKNGRHYWFYGPMKGRPYFDTKSGYTEGVPSGKQMYNTSRYLREIKDDVVKNKIHEALRIFKK